MMYIWVNIIIDIFTYVIKAIYWFIYVHIMIGYDIIRDIINYNRKDLMYYYYIYWLISLFY